MKKKIMSKKTLSLATFIALALTACTDSASVDTPEEPESSETIDSSSDKATPTSSEGANSSANTGLSSGTSETAQSSSSVNPESSTTPEESSSSDTGPVSPGDSFTDTRDGKTYKLVTIGSQIWMAENMKYGDSSLYVSQDAQKICPEGFHLPSSEEFKTLVAYAGGADIAGQKLKSTTGWPDLPAYDNWNGTDEFGFNAKPVESGNGTGTDENYWTSTHDYGNYSTIVFFKFDPHPTSKVDSTAPQSEYGDTYPFCQGGKNASPTKTCFINGEPDTRLSVRCLSNILKCGGKYIDYTKQFCQDDVAYDICYGHQYDGKKYKCEDSVIRDRATDSVYKPSWVFLNPEKEYGIFQDTRDGQYYKTINIDGVVWFAENLNYALEGSLCYEDSLYYCDIYGRLYTHKQALAEGDSIPTGHWQGNCPPGSHLATYEEYHAIYDLYQYSKDLVTSYSDNDFSGEYKRFHNETGLSITFPGTYPPKYSFYDLKWDNLNFDAHYIGSDYDHEYTRDWIDRNLYEFPLGKRTVNDTEFGSVRCIVD